MNRRRLLRGGLGLIGAGALSGCGVRAPWAPAGMPRIGFLGAISEQVDAARLEAFRQGLRELRYVEGQTIAIEWRWGEGQFDRLPALAAELLDLGVALIVAGGSTGTAAAKGATATIPIIMASHPDPVGSGFVASLPRPGGNVTGLSQLAPEISGKRLDFLREIVPHLARLAVLDNSSNPGNPQALRETELAARALGLQVQYSDVRRPEEIDGAFRQATGAGVDALLALGSPLFNIERRRIADLAATHRLPATYNSPELVRDGGLMSYGVSLEDLYRRAAFYVDKILKGATPGDLPIEQPTRFELVINLTTARALGLNVPSSVLQQATKVIQ